LHCNFRSPEDDEEEAVKVDAADAAMANLNALTVVNQPKKTTGKPKKSGNQPTLNQLSSSTTLGFSMQPATTSPQPPTGPYGFPAGTGPAPAAGGYGAGGFGAGGYGFGPTGGAPAAGGYGGGGYGFGGGHPTGPAHAPASGKKGGDAFSQLNIWQ
jgi:hypothetical protein